jgi:hypothetical protein
MAALIISGNGQNGLGLATYLFLWGDITFLVSAGKLRGTHFGDANSG